MPPKSDRNTASIRVSFPDGLDGSSLLRCKAIVGISLRTPGRPLVGTTFVTNQFLKALLAKSQRSFQESVLILGDLIQRCNVKLAHLTDPVYDDSRCEADALTLGDEWVTQNQKIIRNLGERFVRWQMLINDTDLSDDVTRIYAVYADSSEEGEKLRVAIDETANKFADRYCNGGSGIDGVDYPPITDITVRAQVKASSVEYIREELAYLIAYAIKCKVSYFLYPGDEGDFPAFTEARKIFLTGENKDLLQWLKVTFRTSKPQERKISDATLPSVVEGDSSGSSRSSLGRKSPERTPGGELSEMRAQLEKLEQGMSAIYGLLLTLANGSPGGLPGLSLSPLTTASLQVGHKAAADGSLARSLPEGGFFGDVGSRLRGVERSTSMSQLFPSPHSPGH